MLDSRSVVLFIVVSFLVNVSCGGAKDDSIEYVVLAPTDVKNQYSDSLFVTDGLSELTKGEDKLFVSDAKLNLSLILDDNFNVERVISHGNGPEQIGGTEHAQIKEEKLYVFDNRKLGISVYDLSGEFIEHKRIPTDLGILFYRKPTIGKQGDVYGMSLLSEKPIIRMGEDMKVKREFGNLLSFDNFDHKRAQNTQSLLSVGRGRIVSVWTSRPYLELFDDQGSLLSSLDMSEFFQYRIDEYQELLKENPRRKYSMEFAFYRDIYAFEDKIYLLFIGNNKYLSSTEVLVLDTRDNELSVDKIYGLNVPGAFFFQIAVDHNNIFAFDKGAAEIIKFRKK